MNNVLRNAVFLPALLLFYHLSPAQENLRVIDNGNDGNIRYYTVVCPSGKRTSVRKYHEIDRICTFFVNGDTEVCRESWSVDKAAEEACQ